MLIWLLKQKNNGSLDGVAILCKSLVIALKKIIMDLDHDPRQGVLSIQKVNGANQAENVNDKNGLTFDPSSTMAKTRSNSLPN